MAQTQVESFSSTSAGPSASNSELEIISELTRLDRYVLLERIGQGSFASVWAAYDPQLDRRVAIKMLLAEDDAEVDREFLDERLIEAKALAQLSHPNVVAVHDVQTIERAEREPGLAGLFIVMEFLAGQSLRAWMGEDHDWQTIVDVFIDAGKGLAAAHERKLVHRDFKPSNAMFGRDGRIRVLDFGLARTSAELRRIGGRITIAGTPAYMSPEQHLGGEVGPVSDQFSFCAALYEALYHQRPYAGRDRATLGAAKLANEIRPVPRHSNVPAWLHTAVIRGLAPEPPNRFESMEALLSALHRDPAQNRRRWLVGGGLAAIFVASTLTLTQLGKADASQSAVCELPADKFTGIWDLEVRDNIAASFRATKAPFAESALERVESGLDAHVDHWRELNTEICEATMVRKQVPLEVMAEQMHCLDLGLRRVAGLTAVLQQADTKTVARALDSVQSLEPPDSCKKIYIDKPEAVSDSRRDELLDVEAEVAKAESYIDHGRYKEALESSTRAADMAAERSDVGGQGRAALAHMRALWGLGKYEEAAEVSRDSINAATRAGDEVTRARAQIWLLRTYASLGQYDAAEAIGFVTEALVRDAKLGKHIEAMLNLQLALVYRKQQRWTEAEALLVEGLELNRSLSGDDDPELAIFHNSLGSLLLMSRQDLGRAASHYHSALDLWRTHYGEQYPSVAAARNNLGAVHQMRGELELAHQEFEAALDSQSLLLGDDHPQNLALHLNIASVELSQGQTRLARERYALGLKMSRDILDPRHPRVADFALALGKTEMELGQPELGEHNIREALGIYVERHGPDHAKTAEAHMALADCLLEQGQDEAATAQRSAALDIYSADDDSRGMALYAQSLLALQDQDFARANALAVQARELAVQVFGPRTETLPHRDLVIIEALTKQGVHELALQRAREAAESPAAQPTDRRLWRLPLLLARLERHQGHPRAASQAYERALELTQGADGNPQRALLILDEWLPLEQQRDPTHAAELSEVATQLRRELAEFPPAEP
ncbi:serine/threonine kinase family protein [Plesiocystis pacifica SIR-1]|uniref:Serine/threonine kinase family protein n=1 Tax=Plesiocystis pacifica SIR-1 TaxID=391625 RepID=A6G9R4_9BACT|nr:tetratricopeptide repeat protein [Plesiocystis pacifica]EDM77350.1 serine/threonine kinase family protein [Plesiocystis pacifica SIR-1]